MIQVKPPEGVLHGIFFWYLSTAVVGSLVFGMRLQTNVCFFGERAVGVGGVGGLGEAGECCSQENRIGQAPKDVLSSVPDTATYNKHGSIYQ